MRERTTLTTEQLRCLFKAAAGTPYWGHEDEWEARAESIGLPASYAPAVCEAVGRGGWQKAKDPAAYVRTVAQREARKLGLLPEREPLRISDLPIRRDDDGHPLSHDDHLDYLDEKYGDQGGEPSLFDRVSESLLRPEDKGRARSVIDWQKVAKLSDLDKGEQRILALRLKGVSRDTALATAKTDMERRALQAAWRRVDSKLARIREVLQYGKCPSYGKLYLIQNQ